MSNRLAVRPLPTGWDSRSLGDVVSRVTRRNDVRNGNILTISARDGLINQEVFFNRRIASADLSPYFLLERGDFAYNKSYSAGFPVGVIRRLDLYPQGVVSPLYICFRPSAPCVSSDYLAHYFQSGLLDDDIAWIAKEGARNHGLLNVGVSDLFSVPIYVPPVAEQIRIAEILDTADEAIRLTELLIAKLEQAKQGLLHDLLTYGIDESHCFRNVDLHPEGFRVTSAGQIPPSWTVASVGEVGDVLLGRQRSPQHQKGRFLMPYLRVANVFDGFIDYDDVLRMNFTPHEQEIYGLRDGDLLLNEGQSLELVGRCAIYKGQPNLYCFQNTLVRYRCCELIDPRFAYLTFKYWLAIGRFMQVAKKTTSMAHLGASRFAAMPIAVPSLIEQREIVAAFESFEERIAIERDQLAKQKLVKLGLTEDLLMGRVRVRVDVSA